MKNYIFYTLIALCWAEPLIGITIKNTTENNTYLTATIPGQTSSTTLTMQPHGRERIDIKQSIPHLNVTVGSLVPARKQMTPIEPLAGSRGWLLIGRNADGNQLYTPLLSRSDLKTQSEGASVSYALIGDKITRIDSFAETRNLSDQQKNSFLPAPYAKDIDPKSYIMVMRDKKLITKLYAPQVVRAAAAQWYKAQNK